MRTDLRHRRRVHRPAVRGQPAGRGARRRRAVHRAVPGARAGVRLLGVDVPGARRSTGGREYATRIFTPEQEIPFAGHPTLGTAWALRSRGPAHRRRGRAGLRRRPDRGALRRRRRSSSPRRRATWRARCRRRWSATLLRAARAVAVRPGRRGLGGRLRAELRAPPGDRGGRGPRGPRRAAPFPPLAERLAELGRRRGPAGRGEPVRRRGRRARTSTCTRGCSCPGAGVPEDPATGSAAAGLGWRWWRPGCCPRAAATTIRQGVEMGRPSALSGRVEAAGGVGDALPRRGAGAAGRHRRDRGPARPPERAGQDSFGRRVTRRCRILGSGPRVVAGVPAGCRPVGVVGQVARGLDDLAGRARPVARRWCRPSRRRRSPGPGRSAGPAPGPR